MSEPHERLDEAMEERRLALRMTWAQLARAADISPQALRSMRRGEYRPSRLTAQALDRALWWAAGSTERMLDGGTALAVGTLAHTSGQKTVTITVRRLGELVSYTVGGDTEVVRPDDIGTEEAMSIQPSKRVHAGTAEEANEAGEIRPERRAAEGKLRADLGGLAAEASEFEPGSIRDRVEELIRRRKLRQLDRALSLIEDQDEGGRRDAG